MSVNPLYSDPKLAAFRQPSGKVPAKYWLWPLYGAELENLGLDEQPILVDMPTCGPDQLLVRHDAVGLCFSDTKVIKSGPSHPRLYGRDMKANPVVLGHEVAMTIIQVGANYKDKFKPGDRFIIQADIIYKGVGLAYGYALQGGLSQYNVVGAEVLEGDEGCYLLPIKPETGYAQAALTEPWACVTASYDVVYRSGWKPGGTALIVAGPAAREVYSLGTPFAGGQPPARVLVWGIKGALLAELRQRAQVGGFALEELSSADSLADKSIDDLVLLGADSALYELLQPKAAKGCVINLVGSEGFSGSAQVDAGRLHYENLSLVGTPESDLSLAYVPVRTELLAGGKAAFLGAAGPMGQMHFQRALQASDGPALIVGTDLAPDRMTVLGNKYARLIKALEGKSRVEMRTPGDLSAEAFNASLVEATGGAGYDDIVVLAPSPRVVAGAVPMLAQGATMNVFAGLPVGSMASIDLSVVVDKGVRFTGTSGSAIRDLRGMLDAAEGGRLDPNLSVAAISGMKDVKKGLDGVMHQTFPGKIVIYPQVEDFPLTPLEDLQGVLPSVYAKLGPNHSWSVEAEAEFLKEMLP